MHPRIPPVPVRGGCSHGAALLIKGSFPPRSCLQLPALLYRHLRAELQPGADAAAPCASCLCEGWGTTGPQPGVLRAPWPDWGGVPQEQCGSPVAHGLPGLFFSSWGSCGWPEVSGGAELHQQVPTTCRAGEWLGMVTSERGRLAEAARNFGGAGVPLRRAGRDGGSHPSLWGKEGEMQEAEHPVQASPLPSP